jgi:hypothetical protein
MFVLRPEKNVKLNDPGITMAPPDIDLKKLATSLARIPKDKRVRALENLSPEEREAIFNRVANLSRGNISASLQANKLGLLPEDVQTQMVEFDEHLKYLYPEETAVDRAMKQRASQVPSQHIQSVQECTERAKALAANIFLKWKTLNMLVLVHEAIIRKHWLKKSRAHKQELLLKAWPNMSARHRPDLERHLSGQDSTLKKAQASANFDEYMLPYINLEDLLCPAVLLMFVNSRGRHHPNEFAYSDLELAPIFKLREEFLALRTCNFTMAFIGRETPDTYGEIVEWKDAPTALNSIKAGRTVHIDHGMQILHIQQRVWEFLSRCVGLLLVDKLELPNGLTPQPEPSPLTTEHGSITSLYDVRREAPYRLPSRIDLTRLQALASAQKNQMIEHSVLLREDPGYFVEVTERYRNHRPELILDLEGRSHAHAKDFPLYNKAQRQMAADAHCAVFVWHEINERISKLRHLSSKYASTITKEEDLPSEYFEALAETQVFLETISLDLISIVKTEFNASPPLRKYHFRNNPNDPNVHVYHIMPVQDVDPEDKVLCHVLRLLRIFENKGLRDLFSLHVVLDEMERLLHDEPRAKTLITPHITSTLSQLSIMSECLHQIHQFQPWARKVESHIAQHRYRYAVEYDSIFRKWGTINNMHYKFCDRKLFKVGNPKDGKFDHPADQRRTRETVSTMIAAEIALDAFWKAANAHWMRYVGTTPTALVKHIIGDRTLHRTLPWVEPLNRSLMSISEPEASTMIYPFFGHTHDITKQVTGNFQKLAVIVKEKKKTRPEALGQDDRMPVIPTAVVAPTPTIVVDKRTQKVFNSLFHSPNSPNQAGQVAWPDFLHAMTKAGFGAEKLQGSAWHFTPQNLEVERSIQFHEPHPGNKLPFTWARRYGRRLTRTFGWTRDSFALA